MSYQRIAKNKFINAKGEIDIKALQDLLVRLDEKSNSNMFNNFYGKVLTLDIDKAISNIKYSHGLNYIPNFAIITYNNPSSTTVLLHYENFTNQDIEITTNGATALKILIGRLDE